jgi:type IV pilus assembly protein PilB
MQLTQNLLKNPPQEMEEHAIIQFIHNLLVNAVNQGISDLHFEPYETVFRLRTRQDGILKEAAQFSIKLAPRFSSRLKVMSGLDISERRIPQDGRFKITLSPDLSIDFRISTCPTVFGEKVVLRILDPRSTEFNIQQLGYDPFQQELLLKYIHQPQGLVLVTGPTGSGKTISLYTTIKILNTLERNIVTCEDPVEMVLPGINQVSVNSKSGLSFAKILRAFLRQDPDVLMIGEIRDQETAEIAIQAAHTGHLVLSTLHTNRASETIERLTHLGISRYSLATALTLVIAQRLVRTLCDACKIPFSTSERALLQIGFTPNELSNLQLYGPHGCEKCHHGYRGRTGVYEIMPITPSVASLIINNENALTLHQESLKQGMSDLKRSGLSKVKSGITSLEELQRVISIL